MIAMLRMIRRHRAKCARMLTLALAAHFVPSSAVSSLGIRPPIFGLTGALIAVDGRRYRARHSAANAIEIA